jgi:hypothetical protein
VSDGNSVSAVDVQAMIMEAQTEIKTALKVLTNNLPKGYIVTDVQAGCRAQSTAGGGREYLITANITVEVWTE